MKKVSFLLGRLSTGGAERAVSNLTLNISNDVKKEIILLEDKISYPYNAELKILKTPYSKSIIGKIANFLYRYNEIKKIKKNNKDTIIISFLDYPNLLNVLTCKQGTTVLSVRNHMSSKNKRGFKSLFWNNIIKRYYGKADKIIAVSKEIKKDLHEIYHIPQNKIKVIYNSYPIEYIEEKSKEEIDEKYKHIFEKPVIITAGRLIDQKAHWNLIKAFKLLNEQHSDINLVILGEGELQDKLLILVNKLGLKGKVHFLGFQSNPFKFIAQSNMFVLPSLHEGFPNSLAEAMACRVPVISTDCKSGPREILAPDEFDKSLIKYTIDKNRYGILSPILNDKQDYKISNEERILANFMIELIEDEELRNYFANQSFKRIQDFNIENIKKEWKELII